MPFAALPEPRCCQSADWGPGYFLVAGGQGNDGRPTDELLRVYPNNATVERAGKLTSARFGTSMGFGLDRFFVVGGRTATGPSKDILKVDAETGKVSKAAESLPAAWSFTAVVWDYRDFPYLGCVGGCMYIVGGINDAQSAPTYNSAIYRYTTFEPADITVLQSSLPTGRHSAAVFFDGERIFILGGTGASGPLDEVLRLEPENDALTLVGHLPTPLSGAAAVWDGKYAYLVGGSGTGFAETSTILRFDPKTFAAEAIELALPSPRSRVTIGHHGSAYLLGGDAEQGKSADILKMTWR